MVTKTQPVLDTMTVSQARQQFSETLNRVYRGEARVVVEKSGIPVGAIVSPRDLEDLKRLDANRDRLLAAMENLQAAFSDVDPAELDREIEKAVAEIKAERRLAREAAKATA
jgi:prevent-host-death family protein